MLSWDNILYPNVWIIIRKTTFLTSAIVSVFALTACSQAEAPKVNTPDVKVAAAKVMSANTKAVLIYADWCGSCKVLDPKVKEVQSMGNIPGLEFVTLDYTAKDANAFYVQAEAAGVGEAVKTYLDGTIKTGQLLLIDVDDKKSYAKLQRLSNLPKF